ncbi:uncharacterized protein [Rutidosis leptorrhynchoides]|uniref:uncharacterized protein n=1 Tax=Rutidosis leptorrhynchoides TaxID=125765 RepID=UPI003A9A4BB7
MEQTVAPPPQPPPLSAAHLDSSNTNSWGDNNPDYRANGPTAPPKLRLMCSYGGHIVPRPHDKTLCYVGGDTRIVTVDRHTTLSNLTHRLTKSLIKSDTNTSSFTIKYQLPSEDLDSLISVATDEDLENMIDEYERLNSNSRLRLFLFPVQPESVSSIGSLLESTSIKSEEWFVNALNGATSVFSDTSSVNCLLGLDDNNDVVYLPPEKKDDKKSVHDVQSVPDSPLVETTSSFGSGSSLPSLVNLPPIRTNVDDQPKDLNFVVVSAPAPAPAPAVITGVPAGSKVVTSLQQQQYYQQKASMGFDMTSPDSVSSDGSVTNPLSRRKQPIIYQDPVSQNQFSTNIHDQNLRIQDSAYLVSTPTATTQIDPQLLNQQPQFIRTAVPPPQYIQHRPSAVAPMAAYYPMYPPHTQHNPPHPPLDQQNIVYYMPAVSGPINSQLPPPRAVVQTTTKTEPALGHRTVNSGAGASQMVQVPSSQHQIQPQFVAYSHIQQPPQPVASAAAAAGGNFGYGFADPSQQGQHVYYAAQPLPPHSAAQYQTLTSTLPVEAQTTSHLAPDNSTQQPVRTSQP